MSTDVKQAQGEIRETIITLFEIDKMPEDQQEETINRIGKIIFQAVLVRVLPLLEEDELDEYEKLIEAKVAPDDLMNFLFDTVPGFLGIVVEESENFRKEAGRILSKVK